MSVPRRYEPMLAVPWPSSFADPAWLFEPKWDGIRTLLAWDGETTVLRNRRGADITERYPELSGWRGPGSGVVDGELVVLGPDGVPSFQRLGARVHLRGRSAVGEAATRSPVTLIVFDLIDHLGPLLDLGIEQRRIRLQELAVKPPLVVGHAVVGEGEALWDAVVGRGLEGMVAKRLGSPYRPGVRSPDWRKVVHIRSMRAVVGGLTPGRGGRRSSFGALVLGLWDEGRLRWIGNVGTGFADADLVRIRRALDSIVRSDPPFHEPEAIPSGTVWVEPELVARVGYREWTSGGRIRQPRFQGFSADPPEVVTWEAEGPAT